MYVHVPPDVLTAVSASTAVQLGHYNWKQRFSFINKSLS